MAQATNDDGVTVDEIDAAFRVLEAVRQDLTDAGMRSEASVLNEAHYLVQQYDQGSNWHEPNSIGELFVSDSKAETQPTRRTDHYWTPNVGDVMLDPKSNPKYGDGRVEVTEVTDKPSKYHQVDVDTGTRSVAHLNPTEPDDAPVVMGTYVDGSDKEYAFPVSRLERL